MKIGEFSKVCEISKDTVRYYVNIGLLVPKMQNGTIDFTDQEIEDYQYIRRWKNMQFSIQEIKEFLYLKRISNMIEPTTINECMGLLKNKEVALRQEINGLKESIDLIREEMTFFEKRKMAVPERQSGVPLNAVTFLCCPHCRKQLSIENANINGKYIHSGVLKCNCGYTAKISEGIVITENRYTNQYDSPDLSRKLYEEVGEENTKLVRQGAELILETQKKQNWSHKVILEANINGRFFTYSYFDCMPKDAVYIFVDKFPEILMMYKRWIDTLWPDMEILYIADASEKYPLKDECVDVFLSFGGENEYSLYHKKFQITDIRNLLKRHAMVLGLFQSLSEYSNSRKALMERYPEGNDRRFLVSAMESAYIEAGVNIGLRALGSATSIRKQLGFVCYEDGDPFTINYFEGIME